jgi:hypothetical protein
MTRQFSEPHRVSEPTKTRQLRLKTSDRITHAAWPSWRAKNGNEANTVCGRRVHHCDLQHCRHEGRHAGREFSAKMPYGDDVDCITCLVTEARRQQ